MGGVGGYKEPGESSGTSFGDQGHYLQGFQCNYDPKNISFCALLAITRSLGHQDAMRFPGGMHK